MNNDNSRKYQTPTVGDRIEGRFQPRRLSEENKQVATPKPQIRQTKKSSHNDSHAFKQGTKGGNNSPTSGFSTADFRNALNNSVKDRIDVADLSETNIQNLAELNTIPLITGYHDMAKKFKGFVEPVWNPSHTLKDMLTEYVLITERHFDMLNEHKKLNDCHVQPLYFQEENAFKPVEFFMPTDFLGVAYGYFMVLPEPLKSLEIAIFQIMLDRYPYLTPLLPDMEHFLDDEMFMDDEDDEGRNANIEAVEAFEYATKGEGGQFERSLHRPPPSNEDIHNLVSLCLNTFGKSSNEYKHTLYLKDIFNYLLENPNYFSYNKVTDINQFDTPNKWDFDDGLDLCQCASIVFSYDDAFMQNYGTLWLDDSANEHGFQALAIVDVNYNYDFKYEPSEESKALVDHTNICQGKGVSRERVLWPDDFTREILALIK